MAASVISMQTYGGGMGYIETLKIDGREEGRGSDLERRAGEEGERKGTKDGVGKGKISYRYLVQE